LRQNREPPPNRLVWARLLISLAGLLGASGIVVGAAGAHAGGGDLARLASNFLLMHAAVTLGLVAVAARFDRRWPFYLAALLICVGAGAFCGDVSSVAFAGRHVVAYLAPVGGSALILGWIAIAVSPWIARNRPA
jgi:uncharacterized membrane protein YgdD (TMEM256/DUF423 family)